MKTESTVNETLWHRARMMINVEILNGERPERMTREQLTEDVRALYMHLSAQCEAKQIDSTPVAIGPLNQGNESEVA